MQYVVYTYILHDNIYIKLSLKVIQLMSIDLLRQQSRWKEGLLEIRQIIANLVQQV